MDFELLENFIKDFKETQKPKKIQEKAANLIMHAKETKCSVTEYIAEKSQIRNLTELLNNPIKQKLKENPDKSQVVITNILQSNSTYFKSKYSAINEATAKFNKK